MNSLSFKGLANTITVNKQSQQIKSQTEPAKTSLEQDNTLLSKFNNLELLMEPQPQSDEVNLKSSKQGIDAKLSINDDLNLVIKEKVGETDSDVTFKQTVLDSNEFAISAESEPGEFPKIDMSDPQTAKIVERSMGIEQLKLGVLQAKGQDPLAYLQQALEKATGEKIDVNEFIENVGSKLTELFGPQK